MPAQVAASNTTQPHCSIACPYLDGEKRDIILPTVGRRDRVQSDRFRDPPRQRRRCTALLPVGTVVHNALRTVVAQDARSAGTALQLIAKESEDAVAPSRRDAPGLHRLPRQFERSETRAELSKSARCRPQAVEGVRPKHAVSQNGRPSARRRRGQDLWWPASVSPKASRRPTVSRRKHNRSWIAPRRTRGRGR